MKIEYLNIKTVYCAQWRMETDDELWAPLMATFDSSHLVHRTPTGGGNFPKVELSD